jgi:hypothetical protein
MPTTNQTSTVSMELYLRSKRAQDGLKADVKDGRAVQAAGPVTGIVVVADAAVLVEVQAAVREVTGAATLVAAVVAAEEDNYSESNAKKGRIVAAFFSWMTLAGEDLCS